MEKIIKDTEIEKLPSNGVVLAGGCFDTIHPGHTKFLQLSKKQGKMLVILLESDISIRKLKGEDRPMNKQFTRAKNLSKLPFVDFIILLSMPTSSDYYYNLVKSICPDIIAVTSDDPLMEVKKEQASLVGGKVVVVMNRDKKYSTTIRLKESKL